MPKRKAMLFAPLLLACVLSTPSSAWSQAALQLPTFEFFSTSSSVWVPDRGSASLGGMNSSSSGSNQFGSPFFPSNRSYGRQTGASGVTVSVQVHDFQAMDEALLGNGPEAGGRAERGGAVAGNPLGAAGPLASVSELAARRADQQAIQQAEAQQLLARALKARAEGKDGAAKVYLQMAAKRSTGKLKQQVLAALANGNSSITESAPERLGQNHADRSTARATPRTR